MPVDKAAPGVAVDSKGGAAVDPTANVISLNEAANRRQDDLRKASEKYLEACLLHQKEMANLREQHAKEIRKLDTKRLDATRAVDINAGQTEAKRALDALQTLATQTQTNAENLRTALVNTATTIATSSAATVSGITERLAALEKSSYEGAGKDAGPSAQIKELTSAMAAQTLASSNQMRDLATAITALATKDSNRDSKGQGMSALVGYVVVAFGLVATILAIAAFVTK